MKPIHLGLSCAAASIGSFLIGMTIANLPAQEPIGLSESQQNASLNKGARTPRTKVVTQRVDCDGQAVALQRAAHDEVQEHIRPDCSSAPIVQVQVVLGASLEHPDQPQ